MVKSFRTGFAVLFLTIAAGSAPGQSADASWESDDVPADYVVDWEKAGSEAEESEGRGTEFESIRIEEETLGPDEVVETEAQEKVRFTLLKIKGWPEFKVQQKKQCKKIFGRKVCINVPQAFTRSCELIAFAEVSHPSAKDLRGKIESCIRKAVAAGAIAGVYTGNLGAATAALKAALKVCLAAEGVSSLNKLGVTVRTKTKCGKWRPR